MGELNGDESVCGVSNDILKSLSLDIYREGVLVGHAEAIGQS